MKIADFDVSKKVFIIAEIGNNHEGNYDLAKEMIILAAKAGADAVKFQTFCAERYVTISQKERFQQLKKFELTYEQFEQLSEIAKENRLIFLTTPFDIESSDAVEPFVPAYKISSGDNTFWPLIENIAKKGKPIILSTGLADIPSLERAVEIISRNTNHASLADSLAILHCVTAYPASDSDLNLMSIKYLSDLFKVTIGYSDHSPDFLSCVSSVSLGARIIEKHFTYSKENQTFGDHHISANPSEFKKMVGQIRRVEIMLGEYKKEPMPGEIPLRQAVRRSIGVKKDFKAGEKITLKDITWVRPATGFKAGEEELVVGHYLNKDLKKGVIINSEDID